MALKVLPKHINLNNIHKIDLINFTMMQKSLISFFNDDQDEMFNYYDERLKQRLNQVKKKTIKNSETTTNIIELTKLVFNYIKWEENQRNTN